MLGEVKGLVLRTVDIKDNDRLLTVYTDECGLVSALAKGSRTLKSRKMASTMQFCYSSFVLYERGDKYWIREASLIESFYGIRESIEGLALAAYVVEVLEDVATAEADPELLRLALNTLFAASDGRYDMNRVKAAFEVRLASHLGFMPSVVGCTGCSRRDGDFFFDIMAGVIECADCHKRRVQTHTHLSDEHESHILCHLPEGARAALEYCIYCPPGKLFSFSLGDEEAHHFSRAAEAYLTNHLERGFKSLDFYNEVKR